MQNKTLSDKTDELLAFQGIGWMTRKAIGLATVTLHIKQYTEEGTTHINIDQTATGGMKGTSEHRILDWESREHEDHVFGKLNGKSRWLNLDGVSDDFLKEDWLEGEEEISGPAGELHIESYSVNDKNGWTAQQVWGFASIDGVRYYVRRVVVKKGDEVRKVRLVYDWTKK